MEPAPARILILLALVLVLCAVSFIVGGKTFKWASSIIAACWTVVVCIELLVGSRFEIAFVGDVICGLALIWVAWRSREGWPIFLVAIEAMLMLVNALAFGSKGHATQLEIVGYDLLSVLAPTYVTAMALWPRFNGRR